MVERTESHSGSPPELQTASPLLELRPIENLRWFGRAFQWQGSVLPLVVPRSLLFGLFGSGVAWMAHQDLPIDLTTLGTLTDNVVCNLVLGLLLVFRTNTAYDRFWEGRKAWADLVINIRNLLRSLTTSFVSNDATLTAERNRVLQYLGVFAICTKLHLRNATFEELTALLTPAEIAILESADNAPLEVLSWIGRFLQQLYDRGVIDSNHRTEMTGLVNNLVSGLTSCERVQSTPMPAPYAAYLRLLTLIYCVFIPFSLVDKLDWWTGFVAFIISLVLLSIEEIGVEIEDPFGTDANDLPLETICQSLLTTIDHAIKVPSYAVPIADDRAAVSSEP